jgi:hypothetical protein
VGRCEILEPPPKAVPLSRVIGAEVRYAFVLWWFCEGTKLALCEAQGKPCRWDLRTDQGKPHTRACQALISYLTLTLSRSSRDAPSSSHLRWHLCPTPG